MAGRREEKPVRGRAASRSRSRASGTKRTGSRRKAARPSSVERTREMAPVALVSCLAAAVLVGLAVVPVRTWLGQQRKMDEAREEMARIEAEVSDLEQKLVRLQTDAEIERRARQDFDLVFPEEESYRILPEARDQP